MVRHNTTNNDRFFLSASNMKNNAYNVQRKMKILIIGRNCSWHFNVNVPYKHASFHKEDVLTNTTQHLLVTVVLLKLQRHNEYIVFYMYLLAKSVPKEYTK